MRFGIAFPTSGPYANPLVLAELAREAEASAWDGCFLWDHIQTRWLEEIGDPWVSLTAIALATKRIRVGTLVTPLYRRHPWRVARETVTLDRLSEGRFTLGVGLGSDHFGEISSFGGPADDRIRARMLDESLAILNGLWSGEPFSFAGEYYRVSNVCFRPSPLQKPRIPIWIAGTWPKLAPFRRAARYDGVVPVAGDMFSCLSADQVEKLTEFVNSLRSDAHNSYDVVYSASTEPGSEPSNTNLLESFAAAGATWWMETMLAPLWDPQRARERIRRGPPM